MKKRDRWLSLASVLLALCLLFTMMPAAVLAEDDAPMDIEAEILPDEDTEEPDAESAEEPAEQPEEDAPVELEPDEDEADDADPALDEDPDDASEDEPEAVLDEDPDSDEEEDAETIDDPPLVDDPDPAVGTVTYDVYTDAAESNPLYPEQSIRLFSAGAAVEETETAQVVASDYLSETEAVSALRSGMVARNGEITFYFKFARSGEATDDEALTLVQQKVAEMRDSAVAHTGVPNEGDYLQWQWESSSKSYALISNDYSDYIYAYAKYTIAYYTTANQEAEVTKQVATVISGFGLSADADTYDKILAVYGYVCGHVTYDYTNLNDSSYKLKYTCYAALINKTAVCQGYSLLTYRLLLELGVDVRLDWGNNHGWNIVALNGRYYYLDTTWDAGHAVSSYSYFLKGSSAFLTSHTSASGFLSTYQISAKSHPVVVSAPSALTLYYTGSMQTLISAAEASGGEAVYSLNSSGTFESSLPQAADAGDYTVYYQILGDEDHDDSAVMSLKAAIRKPAPVLSVEPSALTLSYTGDMLTLISAAEASGGELVYSLSEAGPFTSTLPQATDAGEYTVYYQIIGDDDHGDSAVMTVSASIAKVNPSLTYAPSALSLTYTGSSQTLITDGSSTDGTLQYGLSSSSLSNSLPKAANAGDYTVYYQIIGDGNHNDSTVMSLSVNIAKTAPTLTSAPSAKKLNYTGSAQTLVNAGMAVGGMLKYGLSASSLVESLPQAKEIGVHTVYYQIIGDSNHNDSAVMSLTVSIAKADPSLTSPPAAVSLTYTGSSQTLITAGASADGTIKYGLAASSLSTSLPKAAYAGTYTIYYQIIGDGNHNDSAVMSLQASIAKASPTLTSAPSALSLTYTGSSQTLITAGTASGGTLKYGLSASALGTSLPKAAEVGTHTVYYQIIGDGNHENSAVKSLQVTILPAKVSMLTASLAYTSCTYTGKARTPVVTLKQGSRALVSGTDYTVSYSNNVNAGKATVTVSGIGNYTGSRTLTFQIQRKSITGMTASLGYTAATYSGKAKKPSVKLSWGTKTLTRGSDYTAVYSNNVAVGRATVTITGTGNYSGTKTLHFKINPKKTYLTSGVRKSATSVRLKWHKISGVTGYQLKITCGSSTRTITVKGASTLQKVVTGLTSGKACYVRVRTYCKVGGTTYVSAWSTSTRIASK